MFTEAQQRELAQSPYILSISKTTIRYSEEFKHTFSDMRTAGHQAEEIVKTLGLDPELLGRERIRGMVRNYTNYQPYSEDNLSETEFLKKQHKELTRQKAILEAENAFLKKKIALSLGGNPLKPTSYTDLNSSD